MRKLTVLASSGAALVLAAAAVPAQVSAVQAPTPDAAAPASGPASVTVSIGPDLQRSARDLGEREVRDQADRLATVVSRELARSGALDGAQVNLVLSDIRPNRPTYEQLAARPGLDGHRSLSTGGATIEGEIITADGQRLPVRYDWYSSSLADVHGVGVWNDADRAYGRLARNLSQGRYVR